MRIPLPGLSTKSCVFLMEMYGSKNSELRGVQFTCKPFNELFWDLWRLFAKYFA